MTARTLSSWLALLAIAFTNGALREIILVPRFGPLRGHQISTLLLCVAILVMSYLVVPWIRPARTHDALLIGFVWLTLTLVFEFGFGRMRDTPWNVMLADYNVLAGRIWPLVLIVTFFAPLIVARTRRLVR